jgi:hypothetical protein
MDVLLKPVLLKPGGETDDRDLYYGMIRLINIKVVLRRFLATVRKVTSARAAFLSGRGRSRSQRNSMLRKSDPAG